MPIITDETQSIDWEAALDQCQGDESFLKEMLVLMLQETESHMVELRRAVRELNTEKIQHSAHSIKGPATNLMCHRLRTIALHVETNVKWGTWLHREDEEFAHFRGQLVEAMAVFETEVCRVRTTVNNMSNM